MPETGTYQFSGGFGAALPEVGRTRKPRAQQGETNMGDEGLEPPTPSV